MNEATMQSGAAPSTGKNYLVVVTGYSTVVVVNGEDEEQAMNIAVDTISTGDFQIEEAKVEKVIQTDEELKRAKRTADCVCEDDEPNTTGAATPEAAQPEWGKDESPNAQAEPRREGGAA